MFAWACCTQHHALSSPPAPHAGPSQGSLPVYDSDMEDASFWDPMLEHLCHPLRVADLLRRMTKGPDYDQLPEALWEKVQKQSMLSPEESAAAEATVLPIREYILPHMRGVLKGFLSKARLDLMAAELGLQRRDVWGPKQR